MYILLNPRECIIEAHIKMTMEEFDVFYCFIKYRRSISLGEKEKKKDKNSSQ